jgi:hypothetical protein
MFLVCLYIFASGPLPLQCFSGYQALLGPDF